MSYWHETMHDDVALIMHSDWKEAAQPREARITGYDNKRKPKYEDADIKFGTGTKTQRWVTDLIPPQLIIDRYFPAEQEELEQLTQHQEQTVQELAEYLDENSAEEGLLYEAVNDDGNIKKKDITDRLKAAKAENADAEEIEALNYASKLFSAEAKAKKQVKEATLELDFAVLKKYPILTPNEVRQLVVMDKWGVSIEKRLRQIELEIQQKLNERLIKLGNRYAVTVEELEAELEATKAVLDNWLAEMGI
ncbi:hypothetical protein [Corynebacterium sp. sy017]|nr:hypothetical protein [Corynebacterium sp. sy017]